MIAAAILPRLDPAVGLDLVYVADRPAGPSDAVAARCRSILRLEPRSTAAELLMLPFTELPRGSWRLTPPGGRAAVAALSEDVDVVYAHGMHSFSLTRDVVRPLVANAIDPWSIHWTQLGREHRSSTRRLYYRLQARRGAALEQATARRAKAYIVVNAGDAELLRERLSATVHAIPNGVSRTGRSSTARDDGLVVFVGSLDYPPNIDAVRSLCVDAFPVVRKRVPTARLLIAGRRPTAEVLALGGDGVEILGDVDDIGQVLRRAAVAAFPETVGRGTRNSVLEAIAAGCPVVAAASSARGIPTGDHIVLASSPTLLGEAVADLLLDRTRRKLVASAATRAADGLSTWDDAAHSYNAVLMAVAEQQGEGRPRC
jgi:glycosyltransferase involved in cell wall biosynthesis